MKILLLGVIFIYQVLAGYNVYKVYTGCELYSKDNWSFWTAADLTGGSWDATDYIDHDEAISYGMLNYTLGSNGKNKTFISTGPGKTNNQYRRSVRMTSTDIWNTPADGTLFMMDVSHIPQGCATWPSWWLTNSAWPHGGEIDIIEGVNVRVNNRMTLHTQNNITNQFDCNMTEMASDGSGRVFTGTWVPGQMTCDETGCAIDDQRDTTFGSGFNSLVVGGTFAMEWTSDHVALWFLNRTFYPERTDSPNPTCWGEPAAYFDISTSSHCTPSSNYFYGLRMVLNTAFCGTWAGQQFTVDCASTGQTCSEYIAANEDLIERTAYWEVESIAVYSNDDSGFASCQSTTAAATTTSTTASSTSTSTSSISSSTSTTGSTSSTTGANPTPAPSPLSAAYVGCLIDSATRDLPNHCPDIPTTLTNEKCRYFCGVRRFTYAGTQSGYQCWCGDNAGSQGTAPASDCSDTCPGDSTELCGGAYRNTVYLAGSAGYLGCYVDSATRDLSVQIYSGSQNYVDTCRQGCAAQGYAYAGLQYGTECWCGNSYGSQGMAADTDCNMPCSGDNTFMCGAGYRNSIYTATLPEGYDYYN